MTTMQQLQRLVGVGSAPAPGPQSTPALIPSFKSGMCSEQGRRPTMEDTHVMIDDVNTQFKLPKDKCRAYYAVYDGHGGRTTAEITKDVLHNEIFKDAAFASGTDQQIEQALANAFKSTDALILSRAEKERFTDGATAVSVILLGTSLFVASIGDAEAVLEQKSQALTAQCISFKHKPMDAEEKQRIEAAGGRVFLGRVLGTLAVTRAFGDLEYKAPFNRAQADFVSSRPFIQRLTITPDNHFLIVACDGLWDKLSYERAVQLCDQAKTSGKTPMEAAQVLVREALDQGTLDNVTCIVVYFDWAGKKKQT